MARPGYGKAKGSAWERVVCRNLSLWLSDGLDDNLLWRSAMSGGRATLQLKENIINQTQAGDISAISLDGFYFINQFVVEAKHYKQLDIVSGLFKRTGMIYSFWAKLRKDAERLNRRPMLVAKQNNLPPFIVLNRRNRLEDQYVIKTQPILSSSLWHADVFLFDDFIKTPCKRREACQRSETPLSEILSKT